MYVIDRGIKLKPGASLPLGTRTFQGNGCIYVEVPEPVEGNTGNEIWHYPDAHPWGATAFTFARDLHDKMIERQNKIQVGGLDYEYPLIPDRVLHAAVRNTPRCPQMLAIHGGAVPECKVLAIINNA